MRNWWRNFLVKHGLRKPESKGLLSLDGVPVYQAADYEVFRIGLGAIEYAADPFVLNDGRHIVTITLHLTAARRQQETP
jgi:hypothetical protein